MQCVAGTGGTYDFDQQKSIDIHYEYDAFGNIPSACCGVAPGILGPLFGRRAGIQGLHLRRKWLGVRSAGGVS